MNEFIGRRTELGLLNDLLRPVRTGCTADVPSLTPEDLHHPWT